MEWILKHRTDRLAFEHPNASPEQTQRVLQASGRINAERFHGFASGILIVRTVDYHPNGDTQRGRRRFRLRTIISLECLAGMADHRRDPITGRLIKHAQRVDFNGLPFGILIDPLSCEIRPATTRGTD